MKKSDRGAEITADQQRSLEEWRNLCFTLEKAQAENLIDNCHEKFQFAKTYVVYGRDLEKTAADIAQSASQGNFSFFVWRGIRADILTPAIAEQMIRDWRSAITSKKVRLAEMFQGRFNEDIEHFIATPHNASRLIMANSFDDTDAILAMVTLNDSRQQAMEIAQVRADLLSIKRQLSELGEGVNQRLYELARRLEDRGAASSSSP
jgi:hypothetical protein